MGRDIRRLTMISAIIGVISLLFWGWYSLSHDKDSVRSSGINVVKVDHGTMKNERVKYKTDDDPKTSLAIGDQLQIDAIRRYRTMLNEASGSRGLGAFIVADRDERSAENIRNALRSVRLISRQEAKAFDLAGKPGGIDLKSGNALISDRSFSIKPANLNATPMQKATFTGYIPAGTYVNASEKSNNPLLKSLINSEDASDGWTGISRVFDNVPGLGRVILEESDIRAGGGVATIPQSSINHKAGDYPATLGRMQDEFGVGYTMIRWIESDRYLMEIRARTNDQSSINALSNLANDIANRRK